MEQINKQNFPVSFPVNNFTPLLNIMEPGEKIFLLYILYYMTLV